MSELLIEVLQDFRDAGGKIVVEQDGAGVEVVQTEPVLPMRDQRLQHQALAVRQFERALAR